MLPKMGLVILTWGNVSGIDREAGLVAIKPSGIPYDELTPENMAVVNMDGEVVSGGNPSVDTATHLHLYKKFPTIGGVVHTHSTWATIFAQSGLDIPPYGTTHADNFRGAIPCTRSLTDEEVNGMYEPETGKIITETFEKRNIDFESIPGTLVKNHGVFTWGKSPKEAVTNAAVLENVAQMAYFTRQLSGGEVSTALLDRHYLRKHGKFATYGAKL